ncbi:hypothetical protein GCM10010492_35440 [Saccharothrix mutabilis subsp. mutabilis]|uniref:Regulator of ribonuclease activity B domain-containing protein n=1 Tax=Saccharothrix mutabilis subsp. mutabilis TaxID=66855 RepID=A0ABN0TZ63_9PSEU
MSVKRGPEHLSRQRALAEGAGLDLSAPVAVTQFFSSPGRHPEAIVRGLSDLGLDDVVVDEEVTGDGFWHVAAFTEYRLTAADVGAAESEMQRIASDAGGRYDGWKLTWVR